MLLHFNFRNVCHKVIEIEIICICKEQLTEPMVKLLDIIHFPPLSLKFLNSDLKTEMVFYFFFSNPFNPCFLFLFSARMVVWLPDLIWVMF